MNIKIKIMLLLMPLLMITITGCVSINEEVIAHGFFRNEQDDLIHKASYAVFKKEYSNFTRNDRRIFVYDENALDVGVEYAFKHGRGISTIYVYPAPIQMDDSVLMTEYEKCKEAVFEHKNVIKLLIEQTAEYTTEDQMLPAKFAAFHIDEDEQLYSLVTLTGKDNWFVLFRTTFPLIGAEENIRDMMSKFPREFDYSAIQKLE